MEIIDRITAHAVTARDCLGLHTHHVALSSRTGVLRHRSNGVPCRRELAVELAQHIDGVDVDATAAAHDQHLRQSVRGLPDVLIDAYRKAA